MPFAALADWQVRDDFLSWRDKVATTSGDREADHRLSAISAMLSWAVSRGRLPANHLKGFKRLYGADRADIIWGAVIDDALGDEIAPRDVHGGGEPRVVVQRTIGVVGAEASSIPSYRHGDGARLLSGIAPLRRIA